MDTGHKEEGEGLGRLVSPLEKEMKENQWLPFIPGTGLDHSFEDGKKRDHSRKKQGT